MNMAGNHTMLIPCPFMDILELAIGTSSSIDYAGALDTRDPGLERARTTSKSSLAGEVRNIQLEWKYETISKISMEIEHPKAGLPGSSTRLARHGTPNNEPFATWA
jgi:hypothetical protein